MNGSLVAAAARLRRRGRPVRLAAVFVTACLSAGLVTVAASSAAESSADTHGSSSRAACREAIDSLPFERLSAEQADVVRRCIRSTTLYRRLPAQTIRCHRELLEFSIDHPEAIVDLWRVLDISRMSLDPAGRDGWRLADGYGTVGTLRLLHREHSPAGGTMLLIGRGGYSGPLVAKPLTGTCLVLLRHRPAARVADGAERHTIVIDAFLDMDGIGLEIVTRTLQPLIVRSAAWNVREICLFVSELSAACTENPEGVARLAARLSRTEPVSRDRLAAIARGAGGARPASGGGDPELLSLELASRWLPADELPSVK